MKKNIPFAAVLILSGLCILQGSFYYPLLADRVASHFDFSGRPDSWTSKEAFILIYFLVVVGLAILFLTFARLAPHIPDAFINIPNKDHWLTAERREETYKDYSSYFLVFGAGTLLFCYYLFREIFLVNIGKQERLAFSFPALLVYLGFVLIWIFMIYRRFRIKS